VLGVLFGWIANWQIFSKFLILLGASSKAGHAAVVAAAIRRHPESYFRIRLKSGGYLLGHPILYSLDGEEPCLFLEKAAFRRARPDRRHSLPVQIDINGPGIIVVNFDEVLFIELV
jgi:hypothetical protein